MPDTYNVAYRPRGMTDGVMSWRDYETTGRWTYYFGKAKVLLATHTKHKEGTEGVYSLLIIMPTWI